MGFYRRLNAILRKEEKISSYLNDYIFYLNRYLTTQPLRCNKILWRGTVKLKNIDEYKPGRVIIWQGFTSTSESQRAAECYVQDNEESVLFKIIAPTAKGIARHSIFKFEREYLLPTGTHLIVTKAKRKVGKFYQIELKIKNDPLYT